jgi:hypothetical protein
MRMLPHSLMDLPTHLYGGYKGKFEPQSTDRQSFVFKVVMEITKREHSHNASNTDDLLSVIVLFDYPFELAALDEALFSLAVQEHENLDIIVVLPRTGPQLHDRVAGQLRAQPWPITTRLRVVTVNTRSSRMVSPYLLNAGLNQAAGRYLALMHHEDIVYQHAYHELIIRLRTAPIAFGGIRVSTHCYGHRHWFVTGKSQLKSISVPLDAIADGPGSIHAFVADRRQLHPSYLTVSAPMVPSATSVFLARLAAHPQADFDLAGTSMFESRTRPHLSTAPALVRLPSLDNLLGVSVKAPARTSTTDRAKLDYKSIPIFINARDLFAPLRRLVFWLLTAGYTSITILDNDSSYPPLLEFYHTMRTHLRVIRLGINVGHTAIWDMKILQQLDIVSAFVLTDADVVPVEECPSNVLEFFWAVLQAYPLKTKVGFGLRIDDLPDHFQLKPKVIAWESQFWEKKIGRKLYDAPIDTTFALYRPGSGYDDDAIRTGFPYLARHVPWYENSDRPSEDYAYYLKNARSGINTWGNEKLPQWLEAVVQLRSDKATTS